MEFKGRKCLQSHRACPHGASTKQRWAFLEKAHGQVTLQAAQQSWNSRYVYPVLLSIVHAGDGEEARGKHTHFTFHVCPRLFSMAFSQKHKDP